MWLDDQRDAESGFILEATGPLVANWRASIVLTRSQQGHAVIACFLSWTLDAFDFFIMVFVLGDIAKEFDTGLTAVTIAITVTLAARPIGALLFGYLADRAGRRVVLMINVLTFTVFELISGLAPSLVTFILIRGLFGVAMGGEWGVGASLTMESIPSKWRGAASGLLQAGYPCGYLLASLLYWAAFTAVGWRMLFVIGAIPGVLVALYIFLKVEESPDWLRRKDVPRTSMWETVSNNLPLMIYAVLMMTAINFYAHGTQDLYPSAFLRVQHGLSVASVSKIAIGYSVGAILGCILVAGLSQKIGRRRAIVGSALLSILVIPLWAFANDPIYLGIGAFFMQFFVQGCFGVVPAHLNELSPSQVRGTFPGFVLQLGNFLAAANATVQSLIADKMGHNYSFALAIVPFVAAIVVAVLVSLGPEGRDVRMGAEAT
jgi:SHS family lactate transporter-like MFS transporter